MTEVRYRDRWELGKHAGAEDEQRTSAPFSGKPVETPVPRSK
jgi:hypothetical protein